MLENLALPSTAALPFTAAPPSGAVGPGVRRRLRSRVLARSFACLLAAVPLTSAATSFAQGAGEAKGEHTIAIWVEGGGPKDAEVRQAITSKLPSNVRVVDDAAFRKEMVKAGQKLPFKPLLGKGPFRKAALDRTRKALAALGAEGAILGNIRIGKGGQEVVVLYVEARDTGEDPDVETPVLLQGGDANAGIGNALSAPIEAWGAGAAKPAEPPKEEPKEEPKDDEKKDEPKEDEEDDAPTGDERPVNLYGRELLSVSAMFDLGGRWFSYTDGVTPNLRAYDVFGAPGFRLGAELYPLAGTDIVVLKDLGFTGGFGMALGLSSETQGSEGTEPQEVTTSWLRVDAGLRLRLRTGSEKAPVLGLHGGFSMDRFELEADGALGDEVPSVGYSFLRVGVDGRIPIGPVALGLFFDYLGAVSAGAVYDRFTGASIGGIALGGSFIVPIASGFEIRVGAEYDRWFYAFEPSIGDTFVAGGALDEYLHLSLGPAYVY